jgi:rhodanese-related sulfurtransferase
MPATATLNTITAAELRNEMTGDTPPVVINTLGPDAYEARRIPGSINVPTDDIDTVRSIVPDTDQPIVVYCANEDCDASPEAARRLQEMGYTNVWDFEAGYAGWREAGFTLTGTEASEDTSAADTSSTDTSSTDTSSTDTSSTDTSSTDTSATNPSNAGTPGSNAPSTAPTGTTASTSGATDAEPANAEPAGAPTA